MTVYRFVFILLVLAVSTFAQTPQTIEQELLKHLKNIEEWSEYSNDFDAKRSDKLWDENEILKKKLVKYGKRKDILQYGFKKLSEEIQIVTSEDGKFRIYSWDTNTGGTMHRFLNVYQYKGLNKKVFAESPERKEGDSGGFYTDIFQVTNKKQTVYLARFSAILMTSLSYQSIDSFKITEKSIDDKIKIFKTKTGLQNSIGFEYDFFSVVDRKDRPIKLILFDEKTQTVKIPIIIKKTENDFDYGTVTDKFISYKFNGAYFVKVN
jgi:hypothetical protein